MKLELKTIIKSRKITEEDSKTRDTKQCQIFKIYVSQLQYSETEIKIQSETEIKIQKKTINYKREIS